MKVILNQNVERIGPVGSIVNVRDGYARNYLMPNGLAVLATEANIRVIEKVRAKDIQKEKELMSQSSELADKLNNVSLTIEVNTGEDEKLYGSVTNHDIQLLLEQKGFNIDRKNILLRKPIRQIGAYQIEISCYTGVNAMVKLWVVKKTE